MELDQVGAPRQITAAQLGEVLRHLASAARILAGAPRTIAAGDREVAEVLLPAWHAAHGTNTVTAAILQEAEPGTPLASVMAEFMGRYTHKPKRGPQAFGELLSRLAGHDVHGFRVRNCGVGSGKVAMWVCSPV